MQMQNTVGTAATAASGFDSGVEHDYDHGNDAHHVIQSQTDTDEVPTDTDEASTDTDEGYITTTNFMCI